MVEKKKSDKKKIIVYFVLGLLLFWVIFISLNHPITLEFLESHSDNPIARSVSSFGGAVGNIIGGEVIEDDIEVDEEEVEEIGYEIIVSEEDVEECYDGCEGDKWDCYDGVCSAMESIEEDCRTDCDEEALEFETCIIEEGSVINHLGNFWNECFPRWTGIHQWTCRFLSCGDWYQTADKLGCDKSMCWTNCDSLSYQSTKDVCEQVGGEWTCDGGWGGEYFCEK